MGFRRPKRQGAGPRRVAAKHFNPRVARSESADFRGAPFSPPHRSFIAPMASIVVEVVVPQGASPGQVFLAHGPAGAVHVTVPPGAAPGTRLRVNVPQAQSALPPSGPLPLSQPLQLRVAPAAPPARAAPPPAPSPALKDLPPGWTRTPKVGPSGVQRYRYSSPGGGHHTDSVQDAWRASRGEKKKSGQHESRKRGMRDRTSNQASAGASWRHSFAPPARPPARSDPRSARTCGR